MITSILRYIFPIVAMTSTLQAASPDISNLNNCINEVRQANARPPTVPTFDQYKNNYYKLIADLQAMTPNLPFVYQEAAAKPLIQKLQSIGPVQYFRIFNLPATDGLSQVLQQMIPDAALSILFHKSAYSKGIDAFQEVVSDLYDSFISEEARVSKATGQPITPPTYGIIPPLVKFGNADSGPYTWPCDATAQILGMKCPIVSLPPAQLKGGLLAWVSLGHETGGHDVLHADAGLLQELSQNLSTALMNKFNSADLAKYWVTCIDELSSDVAGYLHMGPAAGVGLIGYFRALGNGKLRNIGMVGEPHPIDYLRGHLAAAVIKRFNFKSAAVWSKTLTDETNKDTNGLFLIDSSGSYRPFPVSLEVAVASTDVVADVVLNTKLKALEGHSLFEIQSWTDEDQTIVKNLAKILKNNGQLPANLRGPAFYAAHVVSASTLAGLRVNANISNIFNEMLSFLQTMHGDNPTWSKNPTIQGLRLLERAGVHVSLDEVNVETSDEVNVESIAPRWFNSKSTMEGLQSSENTVENGLLVGNF